MITITNLSKNFDQRMLLDKVSLSIYPNEKIGLTGPNGTGKTTLFSIILKEIEPTDGDVQIQKNLNIGYLPQESRFDSKRTILEELTAGDERIARLKEEKHQLEELGKADTPRYGDVLHEMEALGLYDLEHKAKEILSGLGFQAADFNRPIAHLSGGWQMRVLLAKLLTYSYDVLLLDEPTNYLDLGATLWLKDYLKNYKGTFVIISHDKVFLNEVTNYTIVLEEGRITKIKGNYEHYESLKEERLRSLGKRQKVVEKRREQLERFTQRFHAQPNKAAAVRNKRKMLERLETIEIPPEKQSIQDFEFPPAPASGYTVAILKEITKSYGEKKVYENLDFEITRGQKVCLVGANGAGKSTLLKMLAGVIPPDHGTIQFGHGVQGGYFSQTRLDVLNPQRSAFEEVASAVTGGVPALKIRTLLGLFHFHGDDVFKPVQVLSGGEKSRVILAKLLINPPNFILLDEPTTHLDIDGVEALTAAFKAYEGTLCFISHDLFFVREIANHIVEVEDGQLKNYPGGLSYYLEKKKEERIPLEEAQANSPADSHRAKRHPKEAQPPESPAVLELKRKHQEALKRIEQIKKTIQDLEKERKELETESYIKARVLSQSFSGRDPHILKEYGQRLKFIQKRIREIGNTMDDLNQEKREITR